MARGRLLPRDFVRDRRVARLSIEAFAYYQAALAFLDRDGLLTGDADLLLSDLAPLRRTDIDLKMRAIIQEWTTQGLFVAYGDVDNLVRQVRHQLEEAPAVLGVGRDHGRTNLLGGALSDG